MSADPNTTLQEIPLRTPDPRRWLALGVISVATLMVVLDASIVNIALPHAQRDLGIDDADRQWVITAYATAFGGLLLLGGRIVDLAGRKRTFLIGLLGFAAASALGGLAPDGPVLFAARSLQGAFAALLAPAALSLISVTFTDPAERARAFGVYGALQGSGGAIGLIAGGLLTQYTNWRWCLFVNVPIAIVVALAAIPTVRESRAEGEQRLDVRGAVLVTAGLVALVYGFTTAAQGTGWVAPTTLSVLALAVALLGAVGILEWRTAHPLLPPRVVADRNRAATLLSSVLIGAGMFGMLLFLTYYFQVNLGYSPIRAGTAFLPFAGGIVAASVLGAGLVPRLGPKVIMLSGLSVTVLGALWLAALGSGTGFVAGILGPELASGLGLGLYFLALPTAVLSDVEPRDTGVTSALISATQQVGGALGPALLNTLYVTALDGYLSAHHASRASAGPVLLDGYLHGYRLAFVVAAVLFTIAAATVVITKHNAPQRR
ncbi:MFS transporter [Nocardia sp. NPDC005998]|uniref:MFS transporter n=1 Tax=Nocardia sp. NPDC005998 TaxID=3156894 RepID=UPI0033BCBECD